MGQGSSAWHFSLFVTFYQIILGDSMDFSNVTNAFKMVRGHFSKFIQEPLHDTQSMYQILSRDGVTAVARYISHMT